MLCEIVRQCVETGIINGDALTVDTTHIEANCTPKVAERIMKHLAKRIFKGLQADNGQIPEAVNTDVLANSTMTEEQKALPEAYTSDMVASVPVADAAKQGEFANNKGFSLRKPAVSFEGAFSINYFFTPAYAPVDGITLHYWTEADFAAADVLTTENASGSMKMEGEGMGQYRGDIAGIAVYGYHAKAYFG